MGRIGWRGESVRHSQAARGFKTAKRRNAPSDMYDLRGLAAAVEEAVRHGKVAEVDLRFEENYHVADGTVLGHGNPLRRKDELRVPMFRVAVAQDRAWVIEGHGGTFYNDKGLPDNYWMEPEGYKGPARIFQQPARFDAPLPSGETVPFEVAGVIGLEGLVGTAGSNGHGRSGLIGAVKLGV
ncbi:hypothetical protein HYY73_02910 [Candidatus Woesearchaeota archaeon]|nr:hypothetical protein [Candidatus Woesearchaeota archaeon]